MFDLKVGFVHVCCLYMLTINWCLILLLPNPLFSSSERWGSCNVLGSLLFALCILCQRMYQNLISYGETVANGDLKASITPRKMVFSLCATLGRRGREQSGFVP